tara:strand:+ start:276 stop:587 length:312 start_codon:yes stop_codon:yes gene_type:complete
MAFIGDVLSWKSISILTAISLTIWIIWEMKKFKHKIIGIALILFVIVGYLGLITIGQNNNLDLTTPSGIFQATKFYFSWFGSLFSNIKEITSNAISLDWVGKD